MALLDSARLKLQRAADLLAEFNSRMADFRRGDPWVVHRRLEGGGTTHVYEVEIRNQPPGYLGTVIGDLLHNLRSSLDSIAYDFSVKATPSLTSAQERRIGFPIARNAASFNSMAGTNLTFVAQDVRDEIERIQPYHGWDPSWGDPPSGLLVIANYNNVDKHRFVQPIPTMPFSSMWTRAPELPEPISESHQALGAPIDDGDELARFVFAHPQSDIDLNYHPSIDVTIGTGTEPANLHLERLLRLVSDEIVPRFDQYV